MISFERDFINSKGKPIKYKDMELISIDRIPVNKKFSGYLRVVSTNSEWRQGVEIKVNGKMKINGVEGKSFIIWEENAKENVAFEGTAKEGALKVWNAWDIGNGTINAWLNGSAMILEVDGNVRRYKCNDAHPDENFDDIVFEVTINE
jgi:hypothetical protein